MNQVLVRKTVYLPLVEFLEEQGFIVEQDGDSILQIHRLGGEAIFIALEEEMLYFQQELGPLGEFASQEFYSSLLDLNSEITPISAAIDSSGEKQMLILVERRLRSDLDSDELLAILDAMEVAADRIEAILQKKMEG